jgi:putative endopeptidase
MFTHRHWLPRIAVTMTILGLALPGAAQPARNDKPLLGNWGIELQHLSPTIQPGDDFFTYVNEGWIAEATLPQGMPSMNSFIEVHLRSEKQLQDILDALLAKDKDRELHESQVADLYRSYMDEERINALALAPLQADVDAVLAAKTPSDIARFMARPLHESIMGLGVDLDEKNPEQYTLYLGQSGLGLPGREYYLSDKAPFPEFRKAYLSYIESVLSRARIDGPAERAAQILRFETELATAHWTPEESRERLKNYNPMSTDELAPFAPGFDWPAYLQESGVGNQDKVIVTTNTAIRDSAALFARTPLETLRSYLAFHYINNQARYLSSDYRDAHFDFFSRTLNGIDEPRPRNLDALQYVSRNLSDVLGRLYVDRHFPPDNKATMAKYIHHLREALRQHIEQSEWMDKQTKAEAFAKLDSFIAKVGYPDKWRDFNTIAIKPDDLIGNNRRLTQWYIADEIAKLPEPRRDWEWGMSPQTVNAYYSPSRNEIVFPAAILQPPFFDPKADPAVNFAAIGAVIGHEMGHGFDDQGSRSDGKGILRDWWTNSAREQFDARTAVLVEQYDTYEPLPGTHINGQLTLGENIGDIGGLTVAHTAYRNFLKDTGDGEAPVLDGMTGEQRFFLSWAQQWRAIQTEDYLRKNLLTDPHSPAKYRVNGVVRNIDAWYEAFDITQEHKLYLPPEKRVAIW